MIANDGLASGNAKSRVVYNQVHFFQLRSSRERGGIRGGKFGRKEAEMRRGERGTTSDSSEGATHGIGGYGRRRRRDKREEGKRIRVNTCKAKIFQQTCDSEKRISCGNVD